MNTIQIAPSILAADFARLEAHAREAVDAGARWLHVDIMDGRFVPNISFGPLMVRALQGLKAETGCQLDVHLMISDPDRYLEAFAQAGADRLTPHVEATPHIHRTVQHIQDLGLKAGVALNPATPLVMVEEMLTAVDLILIMSVNPGFGGQSYIPSTTDKIRRLRQMLTAVRSPAWIEVDGGIDADNAAEVVRAGATVLVAGSSIFRGSHSVAQNYEALAEAIQRGHQTVA